MRCDAMYNMFVRVRACVCVCVHVQLRVRLRPRALIYNMRVPLYIIYFFIHLLLSILSVIILSVCIQILAFLMPPMRHVYLYCRPCGWTKNILIENARKDLQSQRKVREFPLCMSYATFDVKLNTDFVNHSGFLFLKMYVLCRCTSI